MSDEEELPLQSNDASQTQQSNISSNEVDNDDTNQNIDDNTDNNNENNINSNDDIEVIDTPTNSNPQEDDETQNLMHDHVNNDNDYVDVMVDINNNVSVDNDSKNNDIINTDNDSNKSNQSNQSNQSNNNGYIVVDMDDDNKQNSENATDDDIVNITTNTTNNTTNNTDTVTIDTNITENKENTDENVDINNDNNDEEISIGSEPIVSKTEIIKARILTTWVPKTTLGSELTVIAGDIVTIIDSKPIQLSDNPLALMNSGSTDTNFDKIIILNQMHWTQIQQRNGKIGVIPSNILSYNTNPINDVWIKVKIQHSYRAKASNQLSITSNEKLQIYGCLNEDGMVKAKQKDGSIGLIPWNFVEIPSAQTINDASLRVNNSPHTRASNSSISSDNNNDNNNESRSRHSSIGNKSGHHIKTSSQLKFTIDDTITTNNDIGTQPLVINNINKKDKITSKIKAIGSSISTAIDKIQYASYSHGVNKTLEPMHNISSNLTSPSVGHNNKQKSYSQSDMIQQQSDGYEWSAPLQWKKVYVLKDFIGNKKEIENVYEMFILDKKARGRNESILNYSEQNENENENKDNDPYNAAAPSKAKKTEKDVIKITTIDMIEITGTPSPEGWILARFCNHKDKKGFVPIQCLQLLDTHSKTNTQTHSGGIGALLQQQQLNVMHNTQGNDNNNESVGSDNTAENEIVQPPTDNTDIEDGNLSDNNNSNVKIEIVPRSKQPLPFHWPFSTYPVRKRSKRSKIIETIILLILFIIYLLPVLIEEPKPDNAPKKYNIWWINLFLVWFPWTGIFVLRMFELWSKIFLVDKNPNNKLYGTLLFYVVLIVYFFGLFAIVIEVSIQYEWIKHNSPVLLLATIVEILVFITCVSILILAIIFILIWTFCCRISRNRWETRIEFYCCTRGEPVKTKRYPRAQK